MARTEKGRAAQLLAGAAKTEITPPPGTFINGDFVSHYAQWIHDSLYSKALVLQHQDTTVAMVVVDICVLPKEFVDEVKTLITQETGINKENILISSTHTHAGGSVASVYLCAADLLYTQKLPALIAGSVVKAKQQLRPARVGFGSLDVPEHVRCRRYFMKDAYKPINPVTGDFDKIKTNPFGKEPYILKPESKPDPEVSYLAVQGTEGKWISILANYSLHYVGDWDNGTISADYYGVFAKAVKDKLRAGDEFTGIMSNGTSGNINIWDFGDGNRYPTGKFEKSAFIGNDIAEKLVQSLTHLEWEREPWLQVQYEELSLAVRKAPAGELEAAKKIIAESNYGSLQIDDAGLRSIYAREQVLLNELPDSLPFPIQAFKIGEGIIGALGGEIFAETGLWLKANCSVKKYFTIGLANGNCGYVPPAHEFALGGYETWRSRTSKLEERAEEKIRVKQLQLINHLIGHNEK